MNTELNLIKGSVVEVRRPHEKGIGTVRKVDEHYHIWIAPNIVEFDKNGIGGGWHISEKIV